MAQTWKPTLAKNEESKELKKFLCFAPWTDKSSGKAYFWPSLVFRDYSQMFATLKICDPITRKRLATGMMKSHAEDRDVNVVKPLCRDEYLEMPEEESAPYYDFFEYFVTAIKQGEPEKFPGQPELFLQFMSSFDEAFDIVSDSAKSSNFRTKGLKLLETADLSNANANQGSICETPVTGRAHGEAKKDEEASEEKGVSPSASIVSISEVSEDIDPRKVLQFEDPGITAMDDFDAVVRKLCVKCQWHKFTLDGEERYENPSTKKPLRKTQLVAYLKKTYNWRPPAAPAKSLLQERAPVEVTPGPGKKRGAKRKTQDHLVTPVRGNVTRKSKRVKADTASVSPSVTPLRHSKRKTRGTHYRLSGRHGEKDMFYHRTNLLPFLVEKLDWEHSTSRVPPPHSLRIASPEEDVVFYTEDDAVEYCKKQNFKKRYAHLIGGSN